MRTHNERYDITVDTEFGLVVYCPNIHEFERTTTWWFIPGYAELYDAAQEEKSNG